MRDTAIDHRALGGMRGYTQCGNNVGEFQLTRFAFYGSFPSPGSLMPQFSAPLIADLKFIALSRF
jgi:hypothetical protein